MELEALKDIDKLLESRKDKIKMERETGKKVVGYLCCRVPLELIHAHGMIPVRLGTAAESYMATGKEYIHQFTCPFIKCVVGEILTEGTFLYDNVDVISGSVICLAVSRALEVLKAYTKKPTYYLTIPHLPLVKEKSASLFPRWNGSRRVSARYRAKSSIPRDYVCQ